MKYGSQFSGTDTLKQAAGQSHNAAVRGYANTFDLAVDGNTAEPLKIAALGFGSVVKKVEIESAANLSALTFQVGTVADPDKYGVATAGPAANAVKTIYPPLALLLTDNDEAEDIILTPSAAIPNAGLVRVTLYATHR